MVPATGHAERPRYWPIAAAAMAALVCCAKPNSEDAVPARSGNGVSAPA
jgi:hypothetical protein